jgi:hypothetical protein
VGKKGKAKTGKRGGQLVKLTGAELLDGMAGPAVGVPATGGRLARLLGPPPLKLKSGESFRLATRMHWLVPAKDVVRGLADFPVVMGITFLLSLGDGLWWIIAIVWGLALVHQGKYAYHVLKWRARVVVVTSKRLITTAGVLQRKVDDKSIEKIKGFNVVQSFLGRVFGYGHLVIKLTGGTDTEAQEVIRFVPKPYDVYACARGA